MNKLKNSCFLLASTLSLAVGCDEPRAGDLDDFDDFGAGTAFRCEGSSCPPPVIGNTSLIGDHPMSNLKEALNSDAANYSADIRITGGTGLHDEIPRTITEIDVKEDGQLKLKLGTFGWIDGEWVEGAVFNLLVTPHDPSEPAFTGRLKIQDAECEPGQYLPEMTMCRYVFVTDVEPYDDEVYPETTKGSGWYHTCPDDNEGGTLGAAYRFSSVLNHEVSLGYTVVGGPTIDLAPGTFINGCLNGAVSKAQYRLNVFYEPGLYRNLQASQRTAMLRMWMAWHGGEPRTQPGKLISPHDPIGGLFTWTSDPAWQIEGAYTATGASCRGGALATGVHRRYLNPVANLPGWSSLPHCNTAAKVAEFGVLGVKVNN
ncbi:ADYC domain-containing protein [Nannocystis sp. ILAH1]|uniref:ADYC domain-containing protein n=1 Tax=unclassified Nannocystis TaxID=2627009 RepID=UPI00227174AE|nr:MULTISPECIES: ADYC domain-containing protein [unclassified Nannocystis]MCY0989293.1 ADYC domain-containing protein [Nannocystis sp. ILAH1]MCY1065012.1 ADYC domain-containing protein [Nannocystis sp. RBIL2]